MKRGDLVIPKGHIGLGDAFDWAFAALENTEGLEKGLERRVPLIRSQPATEGISQSEDEAQADDEARSKGKARRFVDTGLDPVAVNADEDARARVELLLRSALSEGHLKALAYGPDDQSWGEIPDRSQWQKPSFAFPGLETFIDPDLSPGPDVNGSPVFLEEAEFKKWLRKQVQEHLDPRLRNGTRGRPSAKSIIQEQFDYRCLTGTVNQTLDAEGKALRQWFKDNHPLAPAPAEQTIRNIIRDAYNEFKIKTRADF